MFGNLSTSRQLKRLRDDKCLDIIPFDEKLLKPTGYTLNPGRVLRRTKEGDWDVVHSFSPRRSRFVLLANEYVIVEPRQSVRISVDGIVGRFVTSSNNIESGFLITAGQIDSKYGMSGEALRFGVKNMLDEENVLRDDARLVHVEVFDLRGSTADPIVQSPSQSETWRSRVRDPKWERTDSDGPLHDEQV
jgi:hypothetical protein